MAGMERGNGAIFVIGDPKTVIGLRIVGIEGKAVGSPAEARAQLEAALERDDVSLLLITYEWASGMRARVDRLKMTRLHPVILEIPGIDLKPPEQPVGELVQRALGIRLRL